MTKSSKPKHRKGLTPENATPQERKREMRVAIEKIHHAFRGHEPTMGKRIHKWPSDYTYTFGRARNSKKLVRAALQGGNGQNRKEIYEHIPDNIKNELDLKERPTFCVYVLDFFHNWHGLWAYIGKTQNKGRRVEDHRNGQVPTSKKFFGEYVNQVKMRVLKEALTNEEANKEEDKQTEDFACKYGAANVTGGSYCSKNYSLALKVAHLKNSCYRCCDSRHVATHCPERAR